MGILLLVLLLWVPVAGADQLQLLLPVSVGARVVTGLTWDGVVVVEPYDGRRVMVSVESSFSSSSPLGPGAGSREWGSELSLAVLAEASQVAVKVPFPQELVGVQHLSPWERVLRVVAWVSRSVRADPGDTFPQDALTVLKRREGRCSGRANLAVALLRQLGVPARLAHGLLFSPAGASWHRWGEAWIPGLGWRPFDPGVAVGALGVRYLPMTGAGEGLDLTGLALLQLDEKEFLRLPKMWGLRVGWAFLRSRAAEALGGAL